MKIKNTKIKNISVVIAFFILTFVTTAVIFPQYTFYYGKNKVIKEKFNWQRLDTEHFNIHYYTTKESLIKKIAAASEDAYKRVSEYLNIKMKRKIPLIYYSTAFDFERTNIAGYIPAGAVAFAESTHYRVVVQGDASFDSLIRTIMHELGHIFEYKIMGRRARYMSPPPWTMEGFSEFITGTWGQFYLLTVRDMVLSGRIPLMGKNGSLQTPYYNARTIPYDFGHIIYEFLDEKFGKRGIKKLLYSLRGGSLFRGRGRNILKVFDYTPKLFNYEFGKYLRKRFKPFESKENPEDYSYIIGPDFPFFYSFSHQVSPSGELLAILTVNAKVGTLDIVLISMKDGKVLKKLTPGFTGKYDFINLKFDPTDGISFTWNKNSNQLAFFARKEWDNYLVVIDVIKGEILKKIKIKGIQDPSSPNFHPGKNSIYFSGQESTKSYIYSMDLQTGKTVKLTGGLLFIKAINISPDGERVIFSAKTGRYYKLFLGTIGNPEMAKQITFGEYNDITPVFSNDERYIYYSSDERGSYNINKIDLQEKMWFRYTDVKTGNFFPIEIPGEKDRIVMSSYYKGTFKLFKKDLSTPQEKRTIEFEAVDKAALAKKEPREIADLDIKYKGKYKPLQKLFIKSLPPLSISVGSDGGLWGYSYLNMTDLMGDHSFVFLASSFYGYRSYHLYYLNQKNRLQLFSHLFAYKEVYYYNPYGYNYSYYSIGNATSQTIRSMYGGEIGFYYPFSRSYRAEATISIYNQQEKSDQFYLGTDLPYGQYFDGISTPLRFSLVGETTRFANYGPNMGHTFKLTYQKYIKFGSKFLDAYTVQADFRKYFRLNNSTLLAFRLSGFKSGGRNALLTWTGGNNTMRSIGFRYVTGNNLFLFNAEFRFPLVHRAATPIGTIGPVRGVFFFDLGGIWFNGQKFNLFEKGGKMKLQDGIASYGYGIEFFLFGYPMHVEWVWRTDFKRRDYHGVNFWIGFDF